MQRQNAGLSPRALAEAKYTSARVNLMLVTVFTLLNILMVVLNSDVMMLFAATVPYYMAIFGQSFAAELGIPALYYIALVISVLLCAPYILCWVFSKKRSGWMVTALVMFALDCAALVVIIAIAFVQMGSSVLGSSLLDMVFHVWVLYYLIIGVRNGYKLKTLPAEETLQDEFAAAGEREYIPGEAAASEAPEQTEKSGSYKADDEADDKKTADGADDKS